MGAPRRCGGGGAARRSGDLYKLRVIGCHEREPGGEEGGKEMEESGERERENSKEMGGGERHWWGEGESGGGERKTQKREGK